MKHIASLPRRVRYLERSLVTRYCEQGHRLRWQWGQYGKNWLERCPTDLPQLQEVYVLNLIVAWSEAGLPW